MFLSDVDIEKAIKRGEITVKPFDVQNLQPASYDIRLGNRFIFQVDYQSGFVDPVEKIFPEEREVVIADDETFILHPGVNVLGTSLEHFGSDRYLIQLNGKSSLARIGLMVHNTAGLINPGHFLNITFELSNANNIPIVLHPKMAIAQIVFSQISSPPRGEYKKIGRYAEQNWKGYIPPRAEMAQARKEQLKRGARRKK